MGDIRFGEEEKMQEELAVKLEEKKISPTAQKLMRQGFANTPRQAQAVLIIIFVLTTVGSLYFLFQSKEFQLKAKPVPRDPYTRPIPR